MSSENSAEDISTTEDDISMFKLNETHDDTVTNTSPVEDDEDEDFVVYGDDTSFPDARKTLLEIESRVGKPSTADSAELTPSSDRRQIQLDSMEPEDEDEEAEDLGINGQKDNGLDSVVSRLPQFSEEAAINCFSDVPLLQGNSDGVLFNGLVFCDTIDSMCRPVVVINTRAIPHKSLRTAALRHLREALEPVVTSGPYVLIFTSFASSTLSKLPLSWVVAAYRELSYPFRKNVQYVILVRPNKLLKALVRVMKLVVSKKAHSKVKEVLYLGDIETVTHGEVSLEHLSPKVIQALGAEELHYSDISGMTQ
eukprot:g5069.t1